jgi:hypothetical protein
MALGRVPGSNLLAQALTVITPQFVTYTAYVSRVVNTVGQWVNTYAIPVTIKGSFQPLPKGLYQAYGLDLQKTYFVFYTLNDLLDIHRDFSNDMIAYNGQTYQCESNTEWYAQDKWKGVLCCALTAST